MKFKPSIHMEELQEPILEQIHTVESLGNTLTWGEQQIPEHVDEVVDIQAIVYDRKRKSIMKRITKKRRLTLDSSILTTTKENFLSIEHAKTSELIGVGMAIIDATLDRERRVGEIIINTRTTLTMIDRIIMLVRERKKRGR
jgi:hypothetical protein